MTHTDLTGVLVALVTPFTADGGEIDAAVALFKAEQPGEETARRRKGATR